MERKLLQVFISYFLACASEDRKVKREQIIYVLCANLLWNSHIEMMIALESSNDA